MSKLPLRAGIIGVGRIAAGFDDLDGPRVTTHIKAILSDSRLTLAAVSDTNPDHARREVARFGCATKVLPLNELDAEPLDVVCIATPDGTHAELARRYAGKVKVVLVEKPIEGDREARTELVQLLEAQGSVLAVNHLRRWIPGLREMRERCSDGSCGRVLSVVVHYGRGLRHNGIHACDLIGMLLAPEVLSVTPLGEPKCDFAPSDPTRSLVARARNRQGEFPLLLVGVDGAVQSCFSVDIRMEKARIAVHDEGAVRADFYGLEDTGYAGFAPELRCKQSFVDDPPSLMRHVWSNIADHLTDGTPLACAGTDALIGYDLLDALQACG